LPDAIDIHTFVRLEDVLARSKTKTFVFETEIVSSPDDFRSLRQSEEHGRKLYNAVLGKLLSSLSQMKQSRKYKEADFCRATLAFVIADDAECCHNSNKQHPARLS
jgi:hypothetical protein